MRARVGRGCEEGGALEGVREWVEHWTRGWRARLERGVRRVEHWMRGWRARVGRGCEVDGD